MALLIDGLIRALETVVDPDELAVVKEELERNANALDRGHFQDLSVSESAFGGSPEGMRLGVHHSRAHEVIAETIDGVVADIRDFREGVVRAESLIHEADSGAGADLGKKQAAVAELDDANRWFESDAKYDHARNEQPTQQRPEPASGGDRG